MLNLSLTTTYSSTIASKSVRAFPLNDCNFAANFVLKDSYRSLSKGKLTPVPVKSSPLSKVRGMLKLRAFKFGGEGEFKF